MSDKPNPRPLVGEVKLWDVEEFCQHELVSLKAPASVICVHGCYLSADEDSLLIAAASNENVTGWRVIGLPSNGEGSTPTSSPAFALSRAPDLCLTLRLIRLPTPLTLLLVGMTTGRLDVWAVAEEGDAPPTPAGTLKGHTDWLGCMDCLMAYPEEKEAGGIQGEHVLVATGSQDNHIRVWHLQLLEGVDQPQSEKVNLRFLIIIDPRALS